MAFPAELRKRRRLPTIIVEDDGIARVSLADGLYATIDLEDLERVRNHKWCRHSRGYAHAKVNGQIALMHRWLLSAQKGTEVDHKDGDKLNNRRSNLRFVSPSQNQGNTRKRSHNKSGFKGVRWNEQRRKWQAWIRSAGKNVYLGAFEDPHRAAAAYDEAAIARWGEHARTNGLKGA